MMDFELKHVMIHGHDVGYRMEGDGPAILLIHGIAGSSAAWREVMPALARNYTVIAPDLIGHGQSAKPVGDYSLGAYASGLRDLLRVLGVARATIVGHSFGGGMAMQLAYQHPECRERGNDLSRMLHRRGIRMARIGEMWRSYASLTESTNRQSFIRTLRSVIDPGGQTVSALDRLYLAKEIPTLIVWGDDDTLIPVSHPYSAHHV